MEELTNEAVVQTKKRKTPRIVAAVLLAAVLLGYLLCCLLSVYVDAFFPRSTLIGVPVGGLSPEAAAAEIQSAMAGRLYTVYLDDPEAPSGQVVLTAEELGLRLSGDFAASVQDAFARQHTGNFLVSGSRYLRSLLLGSEPGGVALDDDLDQGRRRAAELAETLSYAPIDSGYSLEEDALQVTVAKDGRAVDPAALAAALEAVRYETQESGRVAVVASQVLPAETLTAQAIHDAVSGEVKNAGYDAATDAITPEQVGAEFDVAAAQALLDAAAPGETVSVPAQVTFPKVTAEELKAVLFRDVLGECRTHVSGTAARITNVKLAAAAINGAVLNSGETFSYNETTGQRTAAKGYQAAPAYVKGETVDEIGGGVCQPSSTLYYACLRANLEITERYAHRYIPAYITAGMDATVSWGGPDYKFTNNTDYPIKVVTTYAKGYLTIQLLGTKTDDITVKMTNEHLSTTPFETVYEDDPTLAPGTETVKTTPYTGHKYKTYRNLYDGDGNLISSTYEAISDYKSRNKVILRGPAPVTEPDAPALGPAELPAETPDPLPETPPVTPEVPEVPAEPAISETELPVVLPEEPGIVGE